MADRIFEPEISRSLRHVQAKCGHLLKKNLAFECKKVTVPYLSFDRVKDHQVQALLEFESKPFYRKLVVGQLPGKKRGRFQSETPFDYLYVRCGYSYLLVNFRFTQKSPRKDLPKGLNRCFAVRIGEFLEGEAQVSPRKSLPYEWFVENGIELSRMKVEKGYGWDLSPLFEI